MFFRDQYLKQQPVVLRENRRYAFALAKCPHHTLYTPFKDPENGTFKSFSSGLFHPGNHKVTMHRALETTSRYKQVITFPCLGLYKTKPVRMGQQLSSDQFHQVGNAVPVALPQYEFTFMHKIDYYGPCIFPFLRFQM